MALSGALAKFDSSCSKLVVSAAAYEFAPAARVPVNDS